MSFVFDRFLSPSVNILSQVVAHRPDLVITEKGVSDLAQHFFVKAGITAFRRLRKTDMNRVAKATGATIVNRPDEIQGARMNERLLGCNVPLFNLFIVSACPRRERHRHGVRPLRGAQDRRRVLRLLGAVP
jgi:chaperonin GroEL (HSP60 family)